MLDSSSKLLCTAANLTLPQLHVYKGSSPMNTLSAWSFQLSVQKRKRHCRQRLFLCLNMEPIEWICIWSLTVLFSGGQRLETLNCHLCGKPALLRHPEWSQCVLGCLTSRWPCTGVAGWSSRPWCWKSNTLPHQGASALFTSRKCT